MYTNTGARNENDSGGRERRDEGDEVELGTGNASLLRSIYGSYINAHEWKCWGTKREKKNEKKILMLFFSLPLLCALNKCVNAAVNKWNESRLDVIII